MQLTWLDWTIIVASGSGLDRTLRCVGARAAA